jgi:non-heme chloroperoxidase
MLAYLARNLGAKHRAVVFLHAFPLTSEMWMPQLDNIAANGYAALAPNVFGFGGSPVKNNWTFDHYAEALNELLRSLEVKHATLVGVSMGGYKAFAFWKKYPEKVKSLVLCATRAEPDTPEGKKGRQEFIDALSVNGVSEAAARMIPKLFGSTSQQSRSDLLKSIDALIRKQSPAAIQDALRALAERDDATPLLSTIAVPTLVLAGKEDVLINESLMQAIHAGIANSEMKVMDSVGHLPNLEMPDEFNLTLLEHLKTVHSKSP